MGRVKADGSEPVKHRKVRLRGPQAKPRTRAPGAAKLFSDFAGTGSLPRPIQEETPRLWRRLSSAETFLRTLWAQLIDLTYHQVTHLILIAIARFKPDGIYQENESLDRYRFKELIGRTTLPMRRFGMENRSLHTTVLRIDPSRKMARFYTVDVQPNLFGGHSLVREWGRIGRRGRVMIDLYDSELEANAAHDKLLKQKQARGYVDQV